MLHSYAPASQMPIAARVGATRHGNDAGSNHAVSMEMGQDDIFMRRFGSMGPARRSEKNQLRIEKRRTI